MKVFHSFQEANFYVNKSIDRLRVMQPCATVIFNRGVTYSKLIDAYRLETAIRILKQVREKSYDLEQVLEKNRNLSESGIKMVEMQKKSDEIYDSTMMEILEASEFVTVLGENIIWKDN